MLHINQKTSFIVTRKKHLMHHIIHKKTLNLRLEFLIL